jgi:hypothetical protein
MLKGALAVGFMQSLRRLTMLPAIWGLPVAASAHQSAVIAAP